MPKSTTASTDSFDVVDHDDSALAPEELAKLREWLKPTDYLAESGEFRRHLSSQAPGTGLWICQTDEYRKWHDSAEHGSLWIKGVPGAGKSVTAASIIRHLQTTEDCPVLYFFFRNIVAANFSPRALIQDWLAQLLPHSAKLQYALRTRVKDGSVDEAADDDLFQLFLDGASCVPKLYCVGDALDEMTSDNRSFLEKLNGLATHRPASLKLLMTSRPGQHLQSALRDSSIVHIDLQRRLIDIDILSYLRHRFARIIEANENTREISGQAIDMIAQRSQGLFLYAKLTMDQVEPTLLADEPVDIHVLERSLPVGLEQTYNSMLARQRELAHIGTDIQVFVLEAVTHACRPLRLNELASLMKIIRSDTPAPKGFKTLIAESCGPLVEILEDETLQVIHHSFTEFLRGDTRNADAVVSSSGEFPIISSPEAHKHLTLWCLRYLQSGALLLENESDDARSTQWVVYAPPEPATVPPSSLDEDSDTDTTEGDGKAQDPFSYRKARLVHPFLPYAVSYWDTHATHYDVEDEDFYSGLIMFLDQSSMSCQRWLKLQWNASSKRGSTAEGFPTPLHIAAFAGLAKFSLAQLRQGASVSSLDALGRTPLHWAAKNGHTDVAALLLEHKAAADAVDEQGLQPLHLAALQNHAQIVGMLLEAGIEPNAVKSKEDHPGRLMGGQTITKGESPILYATRGGHTETIKAIIPYCHGKTLEELLCQSCRFNRTDAVLAILEESDVSADSMFENATALYFACGAANLKCVQALVRRGADVNKASDYTPRRTRLGGSWRNRGLETPLHHLLPNWDQENHVACQSILDTLIKAGVDLEAVRWDGNVPLLVAAEGPSRRRYARHVDPDTSSSSLPIAALLKAGCDVGKTAIDGDTALHIVIDHDRDPTSIRLLIEHGISPNARGKHGETPLHSSLNRSSRGYSHDASTVEDLVVSLLQQGADPNIANTLGRYPVYLAMDEDIEIFRMLYARCNNVQVKRDCWFKLGNKRNMEDFVEYLEMFLTEGFDINARAENGKTLYLDCLNNKEQLHVLRSHGANTDVVDGSGNNALHILCKSNQLEKTRLQQFVADGVDPLRKNESGSTLLHHVARWYGYDRKSADLVEWLVGLGIDVNAQDKNGSTALHIHYGGLGASRPNFSSNIQPAREAIPFVDAVNGQGMVNFELKDNDGLAVLHLAAMRSEMDVAVLLDAGAHGAVVTKDSQNSLHLACRARKSNVVGQLLETASLDINLQDSFGRTPLHYACSSGNVETVGLLLMWEPTLDLVDEDGNTALHACAEFRKEQVAWDLMAHDRAYWLQNPSPGPFRPSSPLYRNPQSPWYLEKYGDPKAFAKTEYVPQVAAVARMLLAAGVDCGVVNNDDCTALDIALQESCGDFVEIFAQDEDLLAKAMEHLKTTVKPQRRRRDPALDGTSDEEQKQMQRVVAMFKSHVQLARPKSALQHIAEDDSMLLQMQANPAPYLPLMSSDDAASVIVKGFAKGPSITSYYLCLQELMQPQYLAVIEKVADLVRHFDTFEACMALKQEASKSKQYISQAQPALQLACEQPEGSESNLQMIKLLVERLRVDVNGHRASNETVQHRTTRNIVPGKTALHLLAEAQSFWQVEAMLYLIDQGADVNALDELGRTPLHVAASGRSYGQHPDPDGMWKPMATKWLLQKGADPNARDKNGETPVYEASGNSEMMRELLKNGGDVTLGTSNPLFGALRSHNLPALKVLLEHGMSVDSVDENCPATKVHYSLKKPRKVYALFHAAFSPGSNCHVTDTVPLFRHLVQQGADLYVPLNDEETMIHFLFEYPEQDILDVLLEDELCLSRIDFNRRDQRGRTVLMAACDWRETLQGYSHRHWDPKMPGPPLRILDLSAADASLVDDEGKTALHHLLDNPGMPDDVIVDFIEREEVAPTLLQKDNAGFTPLHYALRILRPRACNLLVSKGANLIEPDPEGRTILHHIARQFLATRRSPRCAGRLDIDLPDTHADQCLALWQQAIREGCSINAADEAGNTPLHLFMRQQRPYNYNAEPDEVTHLLKLDTLFPEELGVDMLARNNAGETMLHVVASREDNEGSLDDGRSYEAVLFEGMVRKGLDPLQEDAMGRSALDVASSCDKKPIVDLFARKFGSTSDSTKQGS